MGSKRQEVAPKGVEIRPGSIRIRFTLDKQVHRVRLMTGGVPMAPTPANVQFATRLVAKVREAINLGTFRWADFFPDGGDSGEGLTLRRHFELWMEGLRVADSTRKGYESARRFWTEAVVKGETMPLGDMLLKSLKPSHFRLAIATRPNLSGKTVNNYLGVLGEALGDAVDDDLLDASPAKKVRRERHQKAPPDPFEPDERDAIIAWMAEHAPAQVHNMVQFWFWTGLRTSELFGLKWASVDQRKGSILVHEALIRGSHKDTTKTATSRTVLFNQHAATAIDRQRSHTLLAGDYVFHDPTTGKAWMDERAFRRRHWAPCLKRLGIRYRRPYNMRHTYATAMLMAPGGMMNPAFCARQLGHSVKLFLDTYSKWIEGLQDDAEMARLQGGFAQTMPTKAGGAA